MFSNVQPIQKAQTFTVPAGAGDYAPEVFLTIAFGRVKSPAKVADIRLMVASLPAGAVVECDLFHVDGDEDEFTDPTNTAKFYVAADSVNAAGLKSTQEFGGWRGIRYRIKSGGTGGAAKLEASYTTIRT
jgi:hypothetical protein